MLWPLSPVPFTLCILSSRISSGSMGRPDHSWEWTTGPCLQDRTLVSAYMPGSLGPQALVAEQLKSSPQTSREGEISWAPCRWLGGEFHRVGPDLSSLDLGVGGHICPVYHTAGNRCFCPGWMASRQAGLRWPRVSCGACRETAIGLLS